MPEKRGPSTSARGHCLVLLLIYRPLRSCYGGCGLQMTTRGAFHNRAIPARQRAVNKSHLPRLVNKSPVSQCPINKSHLPRLINKLHFNPHPINKSQFPHLVNKSHVSQCPINKSHLPHLVNKSCSNNKSRIPRPVNPGRM